MARGANKKAEEQLLLDLACGASVEAAARKNAVSDRTIYRRLADPAFRRRLHGIRADMVQRTAGALTAAATEAVRTLLELQKATAPPAVRLGAARSVLEIGLKLRELAELEERLAALEERVQQTPQSRSRRLAPEVNPEDDEAAMRMHSRLQLLHEALPTVLELRSPVCLRTPANVLALLEEQINAVRADPLLSANKKARTIGQLLALALKTIEANQLAARVEMLERVLQQRAQETTP